ncbi:hypothetical protein HK102_000463 [Quaeritorhiza haematococci]|nr:hypothetical protein HK102_000463 [Quaeritorhiza haematococci]
MSQKMISLGACIVLALLFGHTFGLPLGLQIRHQIHSRTDEQLDGPPVKKQRLPHADSLRPASIPSTKPARQSETTLMSPTHSINEATISSTITTHTEHVRAPKPNVLHSTTNIDEHLVDIAITIGHESAKLAYPARLPELAVLHFISSMVTYYLDSLETFGTSAALYLDEIRVPGVQGVYITDYRSVSLKKQLRIDGAPADAVLKKVKEGVRHIWNELRLNQMKLRADLRATLLNEISESFEAAWMECVREDMGN